MTKIKLLLQFVALAAILSSLSSGCLKTNDDQFDEQDMTVTFYDTGYFPLTSSLVFAIRDSVGIISRQSNGKIDTLYLTGNGIKEIKNSVCKNLERLGFNVDTTGVHPYDIGYGIMVNLVVFELDTNSDLDFGWWHNEAGYYNGYYKDTTDYLGGWFYQNNYPWDYNMYSYQEGTLLIEFAVGDSIRNYHTWANARPTDTIKNTNPAIVPDVRFVWLAFINRVVSFVDFPSSIAYDTTFFDSFPGWDPDNSIWVYDDSVFYSTPNDSAFFKVIGDWDPTYTIWVQEYSAIYSTPDDTVFFAVVEDWTTDDSIWIQQDSVFYGYPKNDSTFLRIFEDWNPHYTLWVQQNSVLYSTTVDTIFFDTIPEWSANNRIWVQNDSIFINNPDDYTFFKTIEPWDDNYSIFVINDSIWERFPNDTTWGRERTWNEKRIEEGINQAFGQSENYLIK